MIDTWFGISWGAPQYVLFFPVVCGLIGLRFWFVLRRSSALRGLAGESNKSVLLKSVGSRREGIRTALFSLGLLLVWIALLRPQWGKAEEKAVREGRDIVIALDISRSMLVQDCKGDRLDCAKVKVRRLLGMLGADRVGLVIFSGDALIQCPLTTDYEAFRMFLDDLTVETVSSGTTSVGAALVKIAALFEGVQSSSVPQSAKVDRLAIIFTDGEDFAGGIEAEKEKIKSMGIHLCAVGVGSPEGAPIPVLDARGVRTGFEKDDQGHVVISRLNEAVLQSIVEGVGGVVVRATLDERDLVQIKKWVERFEKRHFDDRQQIRLQERFYLYSAAALLLCALELML